MLLRMYVQKKLQFEEIFPYVRYLRSFICVCATFSAKKANELRRVESLVRVLVETEILQINKKINELLSLMLYVYLFYLLKLTKEF